MQDFGAMGDGVTDDTQAFLNAVNAIGRAGTIFIPEGRYIITQQINVNNRVVFRGKAANDDCRSVLACKPCTATEDCVCCNYSPPHLEQLQLLAPKSQSLPATKSARPCQRGAYFGPTAAMLMQVPVPSPLAWSFPNLSQRCLATAAATHMDLGSYSSMVQPG